MVWGCVGQVGEQTFDIARNAVLGAGWPESVPGVTLDRQCGSSQQAVSFAAASVIAGHYDVVVAGGTESMSRVPTGMSAAGQNPFGTGFLERYAGQRPNQGIGPEMIVDRWGLSRSQLDEFSLASHEKAAVAQDEGRFEAEIAAVAAPDGVSVAADEGVRRGGTLDKLAQLKPACQDYRISDGDGRKTPIACFYHDLPPTLEEPDTAAVPVARPRPVRGKKGYYNAFLNQGPPWGARLPLAAGMKSGLSNDAVPAGMSHKKDTKFDNCDAPIDADSGHCSVYSLT